MSKKKKKKKFKAQLAQTFNDLNRQKTNDIKKDDKKSNINAVKVESNNSEVNYIRQDMKKIYFATGICLLILVVIIYLNQSTDIIKNFSESLMSGSHI